MEHKRFTPGSSIPGGYIRWLGQQVRRHPGITSSAMPSSSTPGINAVIGTSGSQLILAILTRKVSIINSAAPNQTNPCFVPYYEWQQLVYNADNDTYTTPAQYDSSANGKGYRVWNNRQYDAQAISFMNTFVDWTDGTKTAIAGFYNWPNSDGQNLDGSNIVSQTAPPSLQDGAGPVYALNEAAVLPPPDVTKINGGAIDWTGSIVLLYSTGAASALFPGLPTYNFADDGALYRSVSASDTATGEDLFWTFQEIYNYNPNWPLFSGALKSFPSDGQFLQPPNAPVGWGSDGNTSPCFLLGAPPNPAFDLNVTELNVYGLIPYIKGHNSLPVLWPLSVSAIDDNGNAYGTITYQIFQTDSGRVDFNGFPIYYPAGIYSGICGNFFVTTSNPNTVGLVQSIADAVLPKSDFDWTNRTDPFDQVVWPYGPFNPLTGLPPSGFPAPYFWGEYQTIPPKPILDPNFYPFFFSGQLDVLSWEGFINPVLIMPGTWYFGPASQCFGTWFFDTDYKDV